MDYKVKLQLDNRGNHVVRTQSASGKQSPAHNQSSPLPPTASSTVIFKIDKEIIHWERNQNK